MKRLVLSSLLALASVGASAAVSALGDYRLTEFVIAGEAQTLPGKTPLTLSIKKGGEISGFAGCNRFVGFIQAEPLDFGRLATTRKVCADDMVQQREAQYVQALESIKTMKQDGHGNLVLSNDEGLELHFQMKLKPQEKIIWIGPETKPCSHGVMKAECMQYKTAEGGEWQYYYGHIKDFTWVAGKTYKLKVREENVQNPPADASAITTTLIEILEVK